MTMGRAGRTWGAVAGATATATVISAGAIAALSLGGGTAEAFPAYSTKEKKPCAYCHVRAVGGGKRNAAGDYYKAHALSFAGYGGVAAASPARTVAPAAKPKPAKKAVSAKKPATGKKA